MATEKQIAANRSNARRSTGPRTPEGRAVSCLNAYKHGLTGHLDVMTGEQKQARDAFIAEIADDLKPVGPFERQLAYSIAETRWRLSRVAVIENNLFAADAYNQELDRAAALAAEAEAICRATDSQIRAAVDRASAARDSQPADAELDLAFASARTFVRDPHRFQLLTVYEMRLYRKFHSELRQLRDLQSGRAEQAARDRAEALRQKAAEEKQKADDEARRADALREAGMLLNLDEENGETIEPDGVFEHRNGFVFSNEHALEDFSHAFRLGAAKALFETRIEDMRLYFSETPSASSAVEMRPSDAR